eukprot:SAG11_NODE_1818_length_4215_cov_1.631438_6_plen_87_part_00
MGVGEARVHNELCEEESRHGMARLVASRFYLEFTPGASIIAEPGVKQFYDLKPLGFEGGNVRTPHHHTDRLTTLPSSERAASLLGG